MIVRDINGNERSMEWLESVFGPVGYTDGDEDIVVHELWAMCDPDAGNVEKRPSPSWAAWPFKQTQQIPSHQLVTDSYDPGAVIVAKVIGVDGSPMANWPVFRYWPDAPYLPETLVSHKDRAVIGRTNENGDVGFGMGGGDFYFPPGVGATWIWPHWGEAVCGIGMVGATSHWTIWPVFKARDPAPEPEDGIKDAVEYLGAQLYKAANELGEAMNAYNDLRVLLDV